MTLATGATSDGNGGWASVRFNGKSNQQNYLNYDGVDGTYVWDASPGYLNSTGSQFRLQTSMESVAEFRVNSGLAPAESGLGAGGNITVVSKSGTNAFRGSLFEYKRDDALDSASKYDGKKQDLELDQFGGSLGGPIASNRTFFFGSFEGLRQKTGLSFTEAVPSNEARRRILAGEPVGSGAGQSAARTQAVAPLLAGFPMSDNVTSNPLLALATLNTDGDAGGEQPVAAGRPPLQRIAVGLPALSVQRRRLEYARSHRDAAPRAREAAAAERRVQSSVARSAADVVNEFKVGYNKPTTSATAFGEVARIRPRRRVALRHRHLVVDRRARHDRHRAQRPADSRDERFVDDRLDLQPVLALVQRRADVDEGRTYLQVRRRVPAAAVGFPVPGQHGNHLQQRQRLHRQQAERRCGGARLAGVQPAAALPDWLHAGLVAGERPPDARARAALRLLLGREGEERQREAVLHRGERLQQRPRQLLRPGQEQLRAARCRRSIGSTTGPCFARASDCSTVPASSRIASSRSRTPSSAAASAHRTSRRTGLRIPCRRRRTSNALSIRGYTHNRPDEYNMQYGASVSRELPGAVNFTVGYTGSRGKDMFLRGVANTLDFNTRARQQPTYGQIDYKTSGCVDGLVVNGQALCRVRPRVLRCAAAQRHAAIPRGLHRRRAVSVLEEQRHDAGLERSGDLAEHVRLRHGVRHQSAGHPAHVQRLAGVSDSGRGHLARRLARWRHPERAQRRAHQRDDQPCRQRDGEWPDGDEHSRRQQPRHAAARRRSRRRSVSERRRALAQSRGVHDAAARHVRQPRRATRCAVPSSCSST